MAISWAQAFDDVGRRSVAAWTVVSYWNLRFLMMLLVLGIVFFSIVGLTGARRPMKRDKQ